MKLDTKLEDGKLKLSLNHEQDGDQDGKASLKAGLNLELDGLELADELLKDSKVLEHVKGKLGLGQ